jgi:hypothetical protein
MKDQPVKQSAFLYFSFNRKVFSSGNIFFCADAEKTVNAKTRNRIDLIKFNLS